MSRRTRTLIICLAAVLALAAALVAVRYLTGERDRGDGAHYLIQTDDVNDVAEISVKNESGSYSLIQREEGTFLIEDIEDLDIKSEAFEAALASASAFEYDEELTDFGELSQYGVEAPWSEVSIRYNDGTSLTVKLGAEVPNGGGARYAYDGSGLYIVPQSVCGVFGYSELDYVSTDVLRAHSGEPERIVLSGARRDTDIVIELLRDKSLAISGNNTYLIYEPCTVPVSVYEGEEVVRLPVNGFAAESVLELRPSQETLSSYGLDEPDYSIEYTISGEAVKLGFSWIDEENGALAVMREGWPVIFGVNIESAGWIDGDLPDMAYEYIYDVKPEDVSAVSCEYAGKTYDLELSRDGELVKKLCSVTRYDGDALPADGGEPVLTVRISFTAASGYGGDVLKFYAAGERKYGVSLNGQGIYFTAASTYMNEIISALNEIK